MTEWVWTRTGGKEWRVEPARYSEPYHPAQQADLAILGALGSQAANTPMLGQQMMGICPTCGRPWPAHSPQVGLVESVLGSWVTR